MNFEPQDSHSGFVSYEAGQAHDSLPGNYRYVEQRLLLEQEGYLFIFISNEKVGQQLWVDDFSLTHQHGPVVQVDDYFPFGGTFNSYTSGLKNNYLYNGKELQAETDWYDYGARMYMADIGMWGVIDPLGEVMVEYSPYNYTLNNPLNFTDPTGMIPENPYKDRFGGNSNQRQWKDNPFEFDMLEKRSDGKRNEDSPCKGGECLDEVTVSGKSWNWVDELLYRLNEAGGGIEYYNGKGGLAGNPIYHVRNGKASHAIIDPAAGLVAFRENGRQFRWDGRTPIPNTAIKRLQRFLSDGKFLIEFGGKVTEIVMDQAKASQIVKSVLAINLKASDFPFDPGGISSMPNGANAGGSNILNLNDSLIERRHYKDGKKIQTDTFRIE